MGIFDAFSSIFTGPEKIDPYNPDASKFQYGGQNEQEFGALAGNLSQRTAPQADYSKMAEGRNYGAMSRGDQNFAINQYKSILANPKGSIAQQQLQAGQDANVAAMAGMAKSGDASQRAGAGRQAMVQGGMMQAQTNQQAALLQAQERQMATQGLAQAATAQRAQELQLMGIDAQTAQYQAMLEMQSRSLNDQTMLGLKGLGQNASMAQMNAGMGLEGMRSGNAMGAAQFNAGAENQYNAAILGTAATLGAGALAGGGGAPPPQPNPYTATSSSYGSDPRMKEKLASAQSQVRDLKGMLGNVLGTGPRPLEQQRSVSSVKDTVANDADARRMLLEDQVAQGREEERTRKLVSAAQGTGPQPDVITENPGVGQVARDFSTPIEPWEQQLLEKNALRSSGVMQPNEVQASDERSKEKIRTLENALELATSGQAPMAPPGEMQRPMVQQPNVQGLDRAYQQEASRAFGEMEPKTWEYDAEHQQYGRGPQVGIVTSDLKKTPAGRGIMATTPDGMEGFNPGQAASLALAAQADTERRTRRLEEALGLIENDKRQEYRGMGVELR